MFERKILDCVTKADGNPLAKVRGKGWNLLEILLDNIIVNSTSNSTSIAIVKLRTANHLTQRVFLKKNT